MIQGHDTRPARAGLPVALVTGFALLAGLAAVPAQAQEEQKAEEAKGFWERDTLTGDWGGVRSDLEQRGITVSGTYTAEALGNPAGGSKQRGVASGLLQIDVEADLEKLVGWKGGLFHVSGLQTHGRQLSANFLHSWIASRDIETSPSTRLFALWLQQSFLDDQVSVRAGQVPMQEEFFNSTYAANLIGSPFGWPGSFAFNMPSGGGGYPLANLGARVKAKATDHLTLLGAVFSGDPAPGAASNRPDDPTRRNANGTDFTWEQPPVWFGEAQYGYNQDKDSSGLPGTVKVGGWYYNGGFNDLRYTDNGSTIAAATAANGGDTVPGRRLHGNWAAYAILDQMLWRRPGSEDGGLGFFLRGTVMPSDRNQMPYYVDTGLALKGTFEGRDSDVAAIGFAYGAASSRLSGYDSDQTSLGTYTPGHDFEAMLEVSYRYAVTPWWTLVPDAQYIFHPGANATDADTGKVIDDAVVVGLRTVFTL